MSNLTDYFTPDRLNALVGGLAAGDPPEQRFDNSRFLFHPNVASFGVMACNLSVTYPGVPAALPIGADRFRLYTVTLGLAPNPGGRVQLPVSPLTGS